MELPEEILAHIFSFLPLKDKCNAFLVCKRWSSSLFASSAWTHTEIRCESGGCVPKKFSNLLPFIRHLKLMISVAVPEHRETGLRVLQQVLDCGRLHRLCVSCLGNPPLFYAGQDLMRGLVDALSNSSSLVELDLRGVSFTLNDGFVKSVAALCPALRSLFINNSSLVCGVASETIREVLKCCPLLNAIGLFQASVSHDILRDLLEPQRTELMLLELRCERSLKYVTQLSDQIWADVRSRHPRLRVDLELDHTVPELQVPGVLQPSIPVRQLRLHTWTPLLNEIHVVSESYAGTLEVLELQAMASNELNQALLVLASRCTKLREVHCYCVVTQSVIEAFCSLCPHLQRYTLKTRKELHPWFCTTIK